MRYSIPSETKTRYEWIGPLDQFQLSALGVAGFLAWLLWKVGLSSGWEAMVPAGVLLLGAGIAFVRWEGETLFVWIRNIALFLMRMRRLAYTQGTDVAALSPDFRGLSGGVLFIGNGEAILTLQVSSLNLDLCVPEEKERILAGYREFLNSLAFPLQIVSTTQTLNMDGYLQGLRACEEHGTGGLTKYAGDYRRFVERLLSEQTLLTRRHYLVTPWYPPSTERLKGSSEEIRRTALHQLRLQKKVLEDGLNVLGLRIKPMDEQDILTFFLQACGEEGMIPPLKGGYFSLAVTSPRKVGEDVLET